ncbi:unnamed protein product, partial [Meganyctiphanes norvegica]
MCVHALYIFWRPKSAEQTALRRLSSTYFCYEKGRFLGTMHSRKDAELFLCDERSTIKLTSNQSTAYGWWSPNGNGSRLANKAVKFHNNGWNAASAQQQGLYGEFSASFSGNGVHPMNQVTLAEKKKNQTSYAGKNLIDSSYMPAQSKLVPYNNYEISEVQRLNQIMDVPDRSRKRQKGKQSDKDISDSADTDNSNGSKKCGVCGEAARSMHFGGMACDSCKAFFRRSVQSGVWKNFKCPEEQKCPVAKGNRKGCQFCRFQKCKTNGMEVSWVMSESDRMQMWKNRLAKQRQISTQKEKEVDLEGLPPSLDPDVKEDIMSLTKLQEESFASVPYPEECWGGTVESLANTFVCICQKLGTFFSKVEDFQKLCKNDQRVLLNSGIGMSIYLHGAHMYDDKTKSWPAPQCKEAFSVPPVSMDMLKEMSALPEAYNAIMKFYNKYHLELKDEIILVLLSLISFYQSDSPNFEDPKAVQDTQEKYTEYLQHYLKCKEGPTSDRALFPKLLVGLADVREIVEYHNKIDIKPSINHKEKQQLNENAVSTLTDLFLESNKEEVSQFSSILSPKEKQMKYWRGKNNSILRKEISTKGKDLSHPYTSVMFGTTIKTDLILSNPIVELERCIKEDKIDLRMRPRFEHLNSRRYEHYNHSISGNIISHHPLNTALQHQWNTARYRAQNIDHQTRMGKKKAVEVLCEVLQQISCSEDEEIIASLKASLPPDVLLKVAEKLNS